jgi:hypothetical protein
MNAAKKEKEGKKENHKRLDTLVLIFPRLSSSLSMNN